MKVNRYQFDSIVSKTKKEINPISRGQEEEFYFDYLALVEIQVHKFQLKYDLKGRQVMEILRIVLFDIKSILDQQEYDYTNWEEDHYRECADSIETLFLPEKNPDLKNKLKQMLCLTKEYFEMARKCIVRVHESVEQWTEDFGADGYFHFIEPFFGTEIQTDLEFLVEEEFLN